MLGFDSLVHGALAVGAVVAVVSTVPFLVTALGYRHRDNGLAYLLLVLGVGVWNGAFVLQLVNPDNRIKAFFLALTVVGALQCGLGWFLFASTASRTPDVLSTNRVYIPVSVLAGLDIVLAVTTPIHAVYWTLPGSLRQSSGFAVIDPQIGYWLHLAFLTSLFLGGTFLFARAWDAQQSVKYSGSYTVAGSVMVVGIVASALLLPGGLSIAPPIAMLLTTIGWVQARRGQVFTMLRRTFQSLRFNSEIE